MTTRTETIYSITSLNARTLEEILLTEEDVSNIIESDAIDVIERCEQIIRCMNMLLAL